MPVPKRKLTKSRQGNRRSQIKLKLPNLSLCPNCNNLRVPYKVCPICGYYKGEEILKVGPKIKVRKVEQQTQESKGSKGSEVAGDKNK